MELGHRRDSRQKCKLLDDTAQEETNGTDLGKGTLQAGARGALFEEGYKMTRRG